MAIAMVINSCILGGFLLLFAADSLRLRRSGALPAALERLGYAFLLLSLALLAFAPRPSWPFGYQNAGRGSPAFTGIPAFILAAGAIAGASLLLWSVFLEFGWIRKKRKLRPEAIVDSGTYGLCRHPGFWWLTLLVVCLGLLKGVERYYITMILMTALDFLLVFVQDRFIFPRVFPGYEEYRKRVPFLIPGKGLRN